MICSDFKGYETTTAVRGHTPPFCNPNSTADCFNIIGSTKIDYYLKLKESLDILPENPQLNKTVQSFPLDIF